jgi:hypothetical protein
MTADLGLMSCSPTEKLFELASWYQIRHVGSKLESHIHLLCASPLPSRQKQYGGNTTLVLIYFIFDLMEYNQNNGKEYHTC